MRSMLPIGLGSSTKVKQATDFLELRLVSNVTAAPIPVRKTEAIPLHAVHWTHAIWECVARSGLGEKMGENVGRRRSVSLFVARVNRQTRRGHILMPRACGAGACVPYEASAPSPCQEPRHLGGAARCWAARTRDGGQAAGARG
jgi:hypothetical protein